MCWPRVGEANPLFSVCITLCRWTATARLSMPLNDRGISDYLILYQSKNCGHRIHVLFMMYDVYWYCQMKKKRMIMNILKKEWFIWKFWKKGGSREKGGGGNEIHAPCACAYDNAYYIRQCTIYTIITSIIIFVNGY